MSQPYYNEGVRILDEFVCQAILPGGTPAGEPRPQNCENEGIRILQEFVCDAIPTPPDRGGDAAR